MKWGILIISLISPVYFQLNTVEAATGKKSRKVVHGSCQCGKSSAANFVPSSNELRVINGDQVTPIYKYPWMISISGLLGDFECTGLIIDSNKVLTAAHCMVLPMKDITNNGVSCSSSLTFPSGVEYCRLMPQDVKIRYVGASGLSEKLQVQSIRYHPKYDGYLSNAYDIAIITISERFPCDEYTGPICLPNRNEALPGTGLIIAGWGQSVPGPPGSPAGDLLEGQVAIRNPESCQGFPETHFCATGDYQNTCNGDSGGPAFKQGSDGFYFIVGTSSFGRNPECDSGSDEFFTNVYSVLDYVKAAMNSKGGKIVKKAQKTSRREHLSGLGHPPSGQQLC